MNQMTEQKVDNMKNIMKVEYNKPTQRCSGEVKSKLLKVDSNLYNFITKLKNILRDNKFLHQDRMDLHSEVLNNNKETVETFIHRVNILEGREIDVKIQIIMALLEMQLYCY